MTDIPEKDYQKLCPGDKRNITENLRRFLLVLYDVYGPNYHGEDSVGQIILSKQEIIKDFVELMRSEVRPYINVASKIRIFLQMNHRVNHLKSKIMIRTFLRKKRIQPLCLMR